MIAKKIPTNPQGGTKAQVAAQYGLTVEELGNAMIDFLNSEGYKDDGHGCDNLHEWLTYTPHQAAEPFQKGDLNYGLW